MAEFLEDGPSPSETLTGLLHVWLNNRGGAGAIEERLVSEVRAVVERAKRRHANAASPQTTDLLHQVLERTLLARRGSAGAGRAWANQSEFFAAIAKTTVDVLVDDHRRRRAQKRGGGVAPLPLDESGDGFAARLRDASDASRLSADDAALVAEALRELEALDPRAATVVTLRFYFGLSLAEIGAAMGQSERTVKRDWRAARAWLYRALSPIGRDGAGGVGPT